MIYIIFGFLFDIYLSVVTTGTGGLVVGQHVALLHAIMCVCVCLCMIKAKLKIE